MKLTNIKWKPQISEIYEKFDEMSYDKAAEILGVPKEHYACMLTEERHDYIYEYFHRQHESAMADLLEIPSEVELPEEIKNKEDATDWLADEYGYDFDGYDIE